MRFLVSFIFLFFSGHLLAQEVNQKVIDYLGEAQANELYNTKKDKYNHLLQYINHSWYIQDVSFKDLSNIKDIRSVKYTGPSLNTFDDGINFNISNFNPLFYDIKIQANFATTYKLGNSGKIIVFYSRDFYIEKYELKK